MRDRPTVQDVRQLFPLAGAQLGGPSTPMSLQQACFAMLVPGPDPCVSPGAVHLQGAGDMTGGQPLNTEHDGVVSKNSCYKCWLSVVVSQQSAQAFAATDHSLNWKLRQFRLDDGVAQGLMVPFAIVMRDELLNRLS